LQAARDYVALPETVKQAKKQEIQKKLRNYSIQASQIGDTRPVSFCSLSPDASLLATASW
jgi:U4/U6 small nuclear ribonucleoprotein PRP4